MKAKSRMVFPTINPTAASIDIGSKEHYACVGPDREKDVGVYSSFTSSLHDMARWFQSRGVTTIAMESTGVYWKSPFMLLQDYGFEVILVNSSHTKNVSGKKSDMLDCQWIWKLHSAGLLHGSFQPDDFTEQLRTYSRRRKSLIEDASRCVNKMQKTLILMNIHLPIVLSDITGKSGQAILSAILSGETDAKVLAKLVDCRVKASQETIEAALTGFWQEQHLFELQQCWDTFHFHRDQIKQCDEQIDRILGAKLRDTHLDCLEYQPKKKLESKKMTPNLH